jgi:hypothetical protein
LVTVLVPHVAIGELTVLIDGMPAARGNPGAGRPPPAGGNSQ